MELSRDDIDRMESKLDKLAEAIGHLVLVEERQLMHSTRIAKVEAAVEHGAAEIIKVDRKVDQWINRGIGVWGLAGIAFALITTFWRH